MDSINKFILFLPFSFHGTNWSYMLFKKFYALEVGQGDCWSLVNKKKNQNGGNSLVIKRSAVSVGPVFRTRSDQYCARSVDTPPRRLLLRLLLHLRSGSLLPSFTVACLHSSTPEDHLCKGKQWKLLAWKPHYFQLLANIQSYFFLILFNHLEFSFSIHSCTYFQIWIEFLIIII